jgi:hypothetical protein
MRPLPNPGPLRPAQSSVLRGLACALTALLCANAAQAASAQADLDVHGTPMRPACRAEVWMAHRAAIEQAAAGQTLPQLTTLLRAYLCADDASARALVRRHAPPRILQVSEGTGEKPSRQRVDTAEALAPRAGQVYGLQVHRAVPARIVLHWQADEACVHSAQLVHRSGAWAFTEIGSACD